MVVSQYYLRMAAQHSPRRVDTRYSGVGSAHCPSQLLVIFYAIRDVNGKLRTFQDALTAGSALNLYPSLHQCHAVSYNVSSLLIPSADETSSL